MKLGFGIYIGMSLLSLSLIYGGVSYGVNTEPIIKKLGLDPENELIKKGSNFTVAYIIHKGIAPVRIPLTLAAIPVIIKIVKRK